LKKVRIIKFSLDQQLYQQEIFYIKLFFKIVLLYTRKKMTKEGGLTFKENTRNWNSCIKKIIVNLFFSSLLKILYDIS